MLILRLLIVAAACMLSSYLSSDVSHLTARVVVVSLTQSSFITLVHISFE